MRRCLACNNTLADVCQCPSCGWQSRFIDGIESVYEGQIPEGEGFDPALFALLAANQDASFWYRHREKVITWALKRTGLVQGKLLEVGCGGGYVLDGIARQFPGFSLTGVDAFHEGLSLARQRLGEGVELMQADACDLPYDSHFDVVLACDLIEHIADDSRALVSLQKALKPGGLMLITVPQHQALWNRWDEVNCHVRRYSRKELRGKLNAVGLAEVASTSFMTVTLPMMMAFTLWAQRPGFRPSSAVIKNGLSNRILERLLSIEMPLLRSGLSLPVGGSLLFVARKPS